MVSIKYVGFVEMALSIVALVYQQLDEINFICREDINEERLM